MSQNEKQLDNLVTIQETNQFSLEATSIELHIICFYNITYSDHDFVYGKI
jgi:hypothetical protein